MIYIIFTQHASYPVEISSTGAIKGFALSVERATTLLKESLLKENQEDKVDVHGVVIQYNEGPLKEAMWTLTKDQCVVSSYQCQDGKCVENNQVPVDDLNKRVVESKPGCSMM